MPHFSRDEERGFGELCWSPSDQTSIMSMPIEALAQRLTEHGRNRVHFVAESLRNGELISRDE